jgi:phospholipid/cholesterol/gamma-HCH transport system substrate-binding protein
MREQWAETFTGLVVIALAAVFLIYSLTVGGVDRGGGRYEVTAKFGEVGALAPGAAVSVAGVKIGTVSKITLDPKSYLAVAKLSLDHDVKLPADSTAKVTSDSLLGGAHVAIAPGGAMDDLKPGGEIENTQGSVDLFGLIGQVLRPQPAAEGNAAAAAPAKAQTAPVPAPAPAGNAAALPDF